VTERLVRGPPRLPFLTQKIRCDECRKAWQDKWAECSPAYDHCETEESFPRTNV